MTLHGKGQLTIYCAACGRSLAVVSNPGGDWDMTPDGLVVQPRRGGSQAEYRHGLRDVTYTWECRCGKCWSKRHASVGAAWLQQGMELAAGLRAKRRISTEQVV